MNHDNYSNALQPVRPWPITFLCILNMLVTVVVLTLTCVALVLMSAALWTLELLPAVLALGIPLMVVAGLNFYIIRGLWQMKRWAAITVMFLHCCGAAFFLLQQSINPEMHPMNALNILLTIFSLLLSAGTIIIIAQYLPMMSTNKKQSQI